MKKIEKIYTVCQRVLRAAILMPLATSDKYCFISNEDSFPLMIADVFSLRYEKTGAPTISHIYLNKEK